MSSFECEDNFDAQGVSKGRKPRIDTDTHGLIFGLNLICVLLCPSVVVYLYD